MDYLPRIVDAELDELLAGLAAVSIEGPKGVGKTATARQRAASEFRLDEPEHREVVAADPRRLVHAAPPVLIDEWQRFPQSWDLVRRAVDDDSQPNRFILTGSATAAAAEQTHTGAGRIPTVRMRPLSLAERDIEQPTVSLGSLLAGNRAPIEGWTGVSLEGYAEEIVGSGFPGIRGLSERARRTQLAGYVERIIERDFEELGRPVRNEGALRRWLSAYAAAASTTASWEKIRDAATGGEGEKPARTTVNPYRSVLERLWILDDVPAWAPTNNHIRRLGETARHQIADPALAAVLVGIDAAGLLEARGPTAVVPRDGSYLGALFESLLTQSLRVYAQASEARIGHLRTRDGDHEVDLIIEGRDRRVVAVEVKLASRVGDGDVRHLKWLETQLGVQLADAVIVTTGRDAYRRNDGVAVVPAALLGP